MLLATPGCIPNPFATCDGPRPTCLPRCNAPLIEVAGCYGEPFDATCINEDGDPYWYCSGGQLAETCERMVTVCEPIPRDSGTIPPDEDAGP